jgi:hypothetical protein
MKKIKPTPQEMIDFLINNDFADEEYASFSSIVIDKKTNEMFLHIIDFIKEHMHINQDEY